MKDKWKQMSNREKDAAIAEIIGGPQSHPEWYWFRDSLPPDNLPDIKGTGHAPMFAGPKFTSDATAMLNLIKIAPQKCEELHANKYSCRKTDCFTSSIANIIGKLSCKEALLLEISPEIIAHGFYLAFSD